MRTAKRKRESKRKEVRVDIYSHSHRSYPVTKHVFTVIKCGPPTRFYYNLIFILRYVILYF